MVTPGAGAWGEAVAFPLPGREAKPRTRGLTMVIDKGLGLAETRDLLELGAPHVDFLKMAFGTSLLYSAGLLRQKIELVKAYGVEIYPGGTLLEVAVHQRRVAEFFRRAKDLGFTFVEVSEGTIDLDPQTRRDLIARSLDEGFGVLAELGKKDPAQGLVPQRVLAQVAADLAAGAFKVILEGRDSGRGVGIYDQDGRARPELVEPILAGLADPGVILWEAPQTAQQQALLLRVGPHANLGNVQPQDVITLESTRRGLRGDTLRTVLQAGGLEVR